MTADRVTTRQPAPDRRPPVAVAPPTRPPPGAGTVSAGQLLQRRLGNHGTQAFFAQRSPLGGSPATRSPASASPPVQRAASEPSAQRKVSTTAARNSIQTRLLVSSPSDREELEAQATGKKIARMAEPGAGSSIPAPASKPGIFRRAAAIIARRWNAVVSPVPAAAKPVLQRKADSPGKASPEVSAEIQGNLSSGTPLPSRVRGFMEPRFRADFSQVRIHTGDRAASLSRQLNAQAFTVGRDVFFGKDQFKPDTAEGRELVAHELTHTIQQGAAVQRSEEPTVAHRSPTMVQRLGIGDALNFFANKANLIPGFRMFTIILGVNPINMSRVDRSAANILRALIEFLPGGGLITQALENSGVFDKVGAWVEQQIQSLGMAGSAIKQAITAFLDSLSWSDIFDLGGVWERAKRIFTEPIDRIINFAKGLVTGIIQFIKDAILMPLAKLAEGTRGWDLLCAVLGKNPITGDPVPRNAETLIGGFMKLVGQQDVWENMKKANAIGRAWAWFQGAMSALMGFVQQIPTLAINAFKALELVDIVLVPRAFVKVAVVFGNFIGNFISWGLNAAWNLLEIIFDVVSPGALSYIKRTGAALKSILKNPLPFVGNLVKAAKQGFLNFASNFGTHLKAGLIDWLTGSLPGIYIPKAFSLQEIVKFVLSVLGLSWANVRQKLVKVVGETAVKAMETGFDIVVTLVTQGPAAAWDKIKDQLANLKDMVIGGITDFVVDMVVKKAIPKLIAMFIPGAGFISAILSIYDTIMVFVNKISQIIQVVTGFIDSIVAIAAGAIGAAATRVETTLARLLSLAINFLAGFIGLGKVADKVMGVIQKVRAPIDKALDWLVNWIVTMAKKLFAKVFGKKDQPSKNLTPEQGIAEVKKRVNSAGAGLKGSNNDAAGAVMVGVHNQESKWIAENVVAKDGKPSKLLLVPQENENSFWIEVRINPTEVTTKWPKGTGGVTKEGAKILIGMFHGSGYKITSVPDIDLNKLGAKEKGKGLELGTGLYLSHYFHDVKGYAPRKKTHGKDGWIHKFSVPKEVLESATTVHAPDTSGDKAWEGKGDVVRGEWKHIADKSWKAGYQWAIKTMATILKLRLDGALVPYEAADKWGRGRQNEFPEDFRGGLESVESGRKLAEAGFEHNPLERDKPQVKGVG